MLEQYLENSDKNDSRIEPSTFRFRHPKTKKYMLHKMITKQEKEILLQLKRRTKKKDPEYFSKMLKQQKKNMFVSTFIRKLKNSITLHKPPPQFKSAGQQLGSEQIQSVEVSKKIQILISLFLFLQIIPLLMVNSLSLIFQEVQDSQFLKNYNIISFVIHILEMLIKLLVKHDYEQKKKKYLKQNILSYLYSQDFIIDCLILLAFLIQIITNGWYSQKSLINLFSYAGILMKIKTLLMVLSHIELVLIQNEYRAQIWNLIKVFLFNFVIAHFLTILLISMTNFNEQKNWMISKDLLNSQWLEQYIWGYYWATTIMLTVGFGDIVPTNQNEALCMIFIETMSCIVLAYNINRVGSIISKIRSYDLQKNNNLKVFNQISQKTQINTEIEDKITNYIKQSTVIKRNYNIQQQTHFISKLPISFKDQLLKEMNKKIWNGMIFFQNLSEKSLLELSKNLQKKLTHPQQIVYTRNQEVDIMIFNNGTFGLSYNNGNAKSNGKIIQKYYVNTHQFRVASLDFLFQRTMSYDIKCIDYMIYYKVSLKKFFAILQNHPYDYEYYLMIRDKDKYLLNEFQIEKCQICKNQRHSMFKCPRLHYIPLKQHIIEKDKKHRKKKHLALLRSKILKREKMSDVDSLKQRKNIKAQVIRKRLQMCANKSQSDFSYDSNESQLPQHSTTKKFIPMRRVSQQTDNFVMMNEQLSIFEVAVDKIKQGLEINMKDNIVPQTVWELEIDLAHNYKFYFKQFNSEDLGKKIFKKKSLRFSLGG